MSRAPRLALAALPLSLLLGQCAGAAVYVRRTEWSQRPIVFNDPEAFAKESRWIWRDRDLTKFQLAGNQRLFAQVDAWIVSSVKSNGIESLLQPNVPMLAVNNLEYFGQPEARRRFAVALDSLLGKRVFSLSLTDEFDSALDLLNRRNLGIGEVRDVIIPFYSRRTQIHMKLIQIVVPENEVPRGWQDSPAVTTITLP